MQRRAHTTQVDALNAATLLGMPPRRPSAAIVIPSSEAAALTKTLSVVCRYFT
jgi:hypothetical protein